MSITDLAAALKRDPKSVRRDVVNWNAHNPGHGRVKMVEPVGREYRLTAVL